MLWIIRGDEISLRRDGQESTLNEPFGRMGGSAFHSWSAAVGFLWGNEENLVGISWMIVKDNSGAIWSMNLW